MKSRIISIGLLLLTFVLSLLVLSSFRQAVPSLPERTDVFMYMIMPDRFDDAEPANNNRNGLSDASNPLAVQGGDLKGIERRLGYLRSLGVNAIWIAPVQKNVPGAFHGYWIQDFLTVDPRLGTMADLRRLIRKSHALGIRVYLDIVCNHTGPLSEPVGGEWEWNDAGYQLVWRDSTLLPLPEELQDLSLYHNFGEAKAWADPWQVLGELPGGLDDLRTEDARVLDIMVRIWTWWMEQTGCDGYRVDTVKHVDMPFWYAFLEALRVRALQLGKSDFFIFGEVFSGEDEICAPFTRPDSLGRPGFDAVLNFSFAEAVRDVLVRDASVNVIAGSIANLALYHPDTRPFLPTFIDNHDMPRFLHIARGDRALLHQALSLLYFAEGIPVLYYGTEQNFLGGEADYENRESMFSTGWKGRNAAGDSFDPATDTWRHVRMLTLLRERTPVLRKGNSRVAYIDTMRNEIILQRTMNATSAYAFVNRHHAASAVTLHSAHGLTAWPDGEILHPQADGSIRLSCPPRSVRLFLPR
ncbi:MAG: alpha-amylase family glycosyl hydrolase [Bacteroidia bacterium]|nr:alpha-amylase family glycosyl hydrolase [Bacteroidia bacterium]